MASQVHLPIPVAKTARGRPLACVVLVFVCSSVCLFILCAFPCLFLSFASSRPCTHRRISSSHFSFPSLWRPSAAFVSPETFVLSRTLCSLPAYSPLVLHFFCLCRQSTTLQVCRILLCSRHPHSVRPPSLRACRFAVAATSRPLPILFPPQRLSHVSCLLPLAVLLHGRLGLVLARDRRDSVLKNNLFSSFFPSAIRNYHRSLSRVLFPILSFIPSNATSPVFMQFSPESTLLPLLAPTHMTSHHRPAWLSKRDGNVFAFLTMARS